jgi:hypothetical protein
LPFLRRRNASTWVA